METKKGYKWYKVVIQNAIKPCETISYVYENDFYLFQLKIEYKSRVSFKEVTNQELIKLLEEN